MKTSISQLLLAASIVIICTVCVSTTTFAAIKRVGFTATPRVAGVDYTTLQQAHDSASTNDTIQIYPTTPNTIYTATINKKLVFIGTGYFANGGYNQNTNLQSIAGSCDVTVTLDTGATGSVFQGIGITQMTGNDANSGNKLTVGVVQFAAVNNITFKRCFMGNVTMANYAPNDSWTFTGCIFGVINSASINNNVPTNGGVAITNLRVENSYSYFSGGYFDFYYSPTGTIINGVVKNCLFPGNSYTTHFNNAALLFQNCIFYNGNAFFENATNCVFQNNITSSTQSGNSMNTTGSSGNKFGVSFNAGGSTTNFNTVFVGYPNNTNTSGAYVYSPDSKWQLKPGSIAIGAGVGGVDCGIYGGNAPYKLSGIPNTPAFYQLGAPSSTTTTSPYTITFSVRSNN